MATYSDRANPIFLVTEVYFRTALAQPQRTDFPGVFEAGSDPQHSSGMPARCGHGCQPSLEGAEKGGLSIQEQPGLHSRMPSPFPPSLPNSKHGYWEIQKILHKREHTHHQVPIQISCLSVLFLPLHFGLSKGIDMSRIT